MRHRGSDGTLSECQNAPESLFCCFLEATEHRNAGVSDRRSRRKAAGNVPFREFAGASARKSPTSSVNRCPTSPPGRRAWVGANLVRRGVCTVEDTGRLISIARNEEQELRKLFHPRLVDQLIEYRLQVLTEFEKMLANGTLVPGRRRRMSAARLKCPPQELDRGELSAAY
jgi:hypothetical protein